MQNGREGGGIVTQEKRGEAGASTQQRENSPSATGCEGNSRKRYAISLSEKAAIP